MAWLLAVGGLAAGQCEEISSFAAFFARFASEEQFRSERIVFPLHARVGSPSEGQTNERWSKEQLGAKFNPPVPSQRLKTQGLVEKTTQVSSREVEVEQSIPNSDSYIVTYRFKLKNGCWFLIQYGYTTF